MRKWALWWLFFSYIGRHFPKVAQQGSIGQDLVLLHSLTKKKKKRTRKCSFIIFNLWDESQPLLARKNGTHLVHGLMSWRTREECIFLWDQEEILKCVILLWTSRTITNKANSLFFLIPKQKRRLEPIDSKDFRRLACRVFLLVLQIE